MSEETEGTTMKPGLRVLELPAREEPEALDYVACAACEFCRGAECFIDPPRLEQDAQRKSDWITTLPPDCPSDRPACSRYVPRGQRAAPEKV